MEIRRGGARLRFEYVPWTDEPPDFGGGRRNIPDGIKENGSPAAYLELLFSDDICQTFVIQTNLSVSKQETKAWEDDKPLTLPEFKTFLALLLYMDVVSRAGDIKDYWSTHPIWGDPHVRRVMSRDRFLAIRNNYTWMDTTDVAQDEREARNREDGFWTVAKLFDDLKKNYQNYYAPHRHLAVDEMCVFFKGRHRCKCYNPSKPIRSLCI